MLDAGVDPYFKGESGTALEVASTMLETFRSAPRFEYQQDCIARMEGAIEVLQEYAARLRASLGRSRST